MTRPIKLDPSAKKLFDVVVTEDPLGPTARRGVGPDRDKTSRPPGALPMVYVAPRTPSLSRWLKNRYSGSVGLEGEGKRRGE